MDDIRNREDIFSLIKNFYDKVRADELLAPIFNKFIRDWGPHLEVIADFWETTLFLGGKYQGNPMALHLHVDKELGHSLTQDHFGRWVSLWHETIDSMFQGEKTELAKQRATNMAQIMFIKIYQARNSK